MDCRQFVDHGCLGYLIMALSSQHKEVRAAGGHALTRFSTHLEGSRFREKAQVCSDGCTNEESSLSLNPTVSQPYYVYDNTKPPQQYGCGYIIFISLVDCFIA